MRRATGNTAGPDSPPVTFASSGLRVLRSNLIPMRVFMRLMPSAPSVSQALAISVISVTLGESFIIIGLSVIQRTAFTTSAAIFGSVPKLIPPPCTLGQLMFTSYQPIMSDTADLSSLFTTSAYSSVEKPLTLAMTGLWKTLSSFGSSSLMTSLTPGFCRPTELSMPDGHSAMRGVSFPNLVSRVVPLKEKVPRQFMS